MMVSYDNFAFIEPEGVKGNENFEVLFPLQNLLYWFNDVSRKHERMVKIISGYGMKTSFREGEYAL